jgi:predicted amidohydrolase
MNAMPPMPVTRTVAAFQVGDIQDDPTQALAVMRACAGQAAECGAHVACFPEGFLTGYTRERATAQRRAVALDSPRFRTMLDELADCTPVLVFGLIEASADALFNTAVLVERGCLTGVYRKRHPNEACFEPGRELPVFDVAGLRVGIGVCADARDHGDAAQLAAARADVILYPLNNMLPDGVAQLWRHRHVEVLIERARQTDAWVLSADVIGTRQAHVAYGCTAVVAPDGVVRQRVSESQAGMALAAVPLPAPR